LVNIIISLATVKLALFLRELDSGKYKFSLRSKGDIDVSKIAQKYGGGGHLNAAGFVAPLEVMNKIIEGIKI
jgi:phosphoesterase RecJ-like protein